MQLFHATDITEDIATVRDQEAKHLSVVLRKKVGDIVHFTDGIGHRYRGEIQAIEKKKVIISIQEKQLQTPASYLHLAIAPTKNINRIEWLVEKACEIGMAEFTPLLCHRSERKVCKLDKLEKRAASASLQSLKDWFPKMNQMTKFELFINSVNSELKFIAYCGEDDLPLISQNLESNKSVCILIGPEGDFTQAEYELALAKGFKGISFGKTRLRTETAGLMASAMVQQTQEAS